MAEDRVFTLVGRFDDGITKHLAAINKEFEGLGRGLKELTRGSDAFTRSLKEAGAASKQFTRSFQALGRDTGRAFSRATEGVTKLNDSVKGVQGNLQDMKAGFIAASEDSAASVRGIADAYQEVIAAAQQAADAAKGIGGDAQPFNGGRGGRGSEGEGFTIRKGVVANLIASGVETIAGTAISIAQGALGAVAGKVREAIKDELSDIATAGGIFSMGKVGKIPWADTYEKAFAVQRELEGRMSKLAAALPGETDDYVRNAKMVTDTVMNIGMKAGPEFVKMMQGFDRSVATTKDAFLRGTEELAKYATLTDVVSPSGGLPFNQLVEQLMSDEKISSTTLKRRYNAIKRNPLLSGAIDRNLDELNKAAAGTPGRFKAMLKLLKEMYPPEVIMAMQNSVDGITQTMKSSLFSMNTGLFGLKREIKVATEGFNTMHAGKEITTTLYDMGAKVYAAFGTVMNPILEALPMILDPIKQAGEILEEMYFNAENTLSNFKAAYEKFGKLRFNGKALSGMEIGFRSSMETIARLAKAFGGDTKKIADLETMLGGEKLDFGAAITKALDALFSSDAMDRLGYAIGKALGTIMSDIAKMVSKGGEVLNQSGLVAGFTRGWNEGKGSEGLGKLLGDGIRLAFKAVGGLVVEAFKNAPLETTVIAGLVTGVLPGVAVKVTEWLLAKVGTAIVTRLAALNVAGWVAGAVIPAIASAATAIGATVAGWLGAVGPTIAAIANPIGIAAAIVTAVGLLVYAFKDQIRAAIEMVASWIKGNVTGPLREALLGVTTVWKGVVNTIVGSVDWLLGLVTGDKKRMEAGAQAVSQGVGQFFSGWKAIIANLIGALNQAYKAVAGWAVNALVNGAKAFINGIVNVVKGAVNGLNGLQGNFVSTVGGAVMGLAKRIFSWLTGIPLPNTPTPTRPPADSNKTPIPNQNPDPRPQPLPLPQPINDAIDFYKWVTKPKPEPNAQPQYDGTGKAVPLLEAIRTEMVNKPAGSDLVIANSTETVIPAFDGWMPKVPTIEVPQAVPAAKGNEGSAISSLSNGLKSVFGAVANGFKAVNQQYQSLAAGVTTLRVETSVAYNQSERRNADRYQQTSEQIGNNHRQTQQQLATLSGNLTELTARVGTLSTTMSQMGGLGGSLFGMGGGASGVNKVVAVGKELQGMGLRVAENPAFGTGRVGQHAPNSLHYAGRAIDVTGPSALLDQAYTQLKATNPTELLWRTAGHYDHLHVAYALGKGMPAFFNSMRAAQEWERSMVPGSVKVSSVTGNSAEGFGDTVVNVGGVTVHAGNVQDADELASIVAIKIGEAVATARAASMFV
jgi:hypothetical protein